MLNCFLIQVRRSRSKRCRPQYPRCTSLYQDAKTRGVLINIHGLRHDAAGIPAADNRYTDRSSIKQSDRTQKDHRFCDDQHRPSQRDGLRLTRHTGQRLAIDLFVDSTREGRVQGARISAWWRAVMVSCCKRRTLDSRFGKVTNTQREATIFLGEMMRLRFYEQ